MQPTLLDMFTIRGDVDRRNNGNIALVTRMTPMTLVSTANRTVAGSTVVGICDAPPVMPALFTSTSRRPECSSISLAAASTLVSFVTSSGMPNASNPAAAQLRHGVLAAPFIPGAHADTPAEGAQSSCYFVSNTLICAGYQRDRLFSHRGEFSSGRGGKSKTIWVGIDTAKVWFLLVAAYCGGVEDAEKLRYFIAVAEELHFGRAAQRLGMAQPPLSRAIRQLERRLGSRLLERNSRTVTLTETGLVLLREGRVALDAVEAAERRARRAAFAATGHTGVALVTKAGASSELLTKLLDAYAAEPESVAVDVLLCGVGEQEQLLRDGRADVALLHRPFDAMVGFDTQELGTQGQVVVLPAGHPLTSRTQVQMADIEELPGLPLPLLAATRWGVPGRSRSVGSGPHAATPVGCAWSRLGGSTGVVPSSAARRPRCHSSSGRANGHDGHRLAIA